MLADPMLLDEEAPEEREPTAYEVMREEHTYWASLPLEELVPELEQRAKWYYEHVEETGRRALWQRQLSTFRGFDPDGSYRHSSAVTYHGEVGEVVQLSTAHYSAILQGVHALVTGIKPTTRAIASTGTGDGMEDAAIADKLLEYDAAQRGLGSLLARAALIAMYAGEGWTYQWWDHMQGREVGAGEDGQIQYEGDVSATVLHPIHVVRDPDSHLEGDQPHEWLMVRVPTNRWTLMRQFPEHAGAIADAPSVRQEEREWTLFPSARDQGTARGTDYVYVWHWYHDTTPALPQGRFAAYVAGVPLMESPLPYADMPLHPIYPDVDDEEAFGFTPMTHLLAPQQAYDATLSAALTNIDAGGINNYWTQDGDNIAVEQLAGGLNHLTSQTKPEILEGAKVGEALWKFLDVVERNMEKLSGSNSVTRGQPDESLKSGAALALIQSMAVQHNSPHQRGYANLIERFYSARVRIWQRFVTAERVAEIAGDDERVNATRWTGESLSGVTRVKVELSHPRMATSEGRQEMADKLLEVAMKAGWNLTPEEYMSVVETGRLEPMTKHAREEYRLIARENQALRDYQPPPMPPPDPFGAVDPMTGQPMPPPPPPSPVKALVTDKHRLHIKEHATLLSDPAIRMDNEPLAAVVLAHIQEHITMLASTDPTILEAIGEPPPSAPMGMPGMPPGAPPGPGGPMPAMGGGEPPGAPPVSADVSGAPGGPPPGMPSMPRVPQGAALPEAGEPPPVMGG